MLYHAVNEQKSRCLFTAMQEDAASTKASHNHHVLSCLSTISTLPFNDQRSRLQFKASFQQSAIPSPQSSFFDSRSTKPQCRLRDNPLSVVTSTSSILTTSRSTSTRQSLAQTTTTSYQRFPSSTGKTRHPSMTTSRPVVYMGLQHLRTFLRIR